MEFPRDHTDHVSSGLRRLVDDIQATTPVASNGLGQIVCGTSALAGFSQERVEYCGVDVADLVDSVSFEAVVWLLLTGQLPAEEQLADVAAIMRDSAFVEQSAVDALSGLPLRTKPLELLPLSVSMLSCFDPVQIDRSPAATRSRVWRMLAQLPVLLSCVLDGPAAGERPAQDRDQPTLAGSVLQLVRTSDSTSHRPPTGSVLEVEAVNAVLTCQCLTELRPACFAARFFGSTVGDVVPSLRSATSLYVAQMKNDPYEWIGSRLRSFDSPDQAEEWFCGRKTQRLPFGFTNEERDPRAEILQQVARRLLGCEERIRLAACARRLELLMDRRDWYPTMDWSASVVLSLLDVQPERMSLVIAMARLVGWAAQAIEQEASGVTLLPQLHYSQ